MNKKISKLIYSGKIVASIILILGLIHDVATFTPLIREGLECLSESDLDAMTYMSLICGSSLILSGILVIMLLNKVEKFNWLIMPVLLISAFLCTNGILSIFYMYDNPFAWLTFIFGLTSFAISLLIKRKI